MKCTAEDICLLERKPAGTITVTPMDLVAYTGGDSLHGNSFPAARYQITAKGVDLSNVTFTVDGKAESLPEGTESGDIVVLEWLPAVYTLEETGSMGLSLLNGEGNAAENDAIAGEYTIEADSDDVTATVDGTPVALQWEKGTLTVRNVSNPDGVINETVDVAQPVVSDAGEVDTDDGIGIAVIPSGTKYYTNCKEELGLLGDQDAANPQISLLFDELLPGEDGKTTNQLLIDLADKSGYNFTA